MLRLAGLPAARGSTHRPPGSPFPAPAHAEVFLGLVRDLRLSGPLLSDVHLAALALEQGTGIWPTDADFARLPGLRWEDPLRG